MARLHSSITVSTSNVTRSGECYSLCRGCLKLEGRQGPQTAFCDLFAPFNSSLAGWRHDVPSIRTHSRCVGATCVPTWTRYEWHPLSQALQCPHQMGTGLDTDEDCERCQDHRDTVDRVEEIDELPPVFRVHFQK